MTPVVEPGRWAVISGRFPHSAEVFRIDAVTERQIKNRVSENPTRFRHAPASDVLATFETFPEADKLRQAIDGIRGEVIRREREAAEYGRKAIDALVAGL